MSQHKFRSVASLFAVALLATACPVGPAYKTRALGGTITGLKGTGLVLQFNNSDDLTIDPGATSFQFDSRTVDSWSYEVTVLTQPTNPSQTCKVENGSGTTNGADVTSVAITCTTNTYTVGGSVSGLLGNGAGLVLQLNGGEKLPVAVAGNFAFSAKIESGAAYSVSVATQPANPAQTCSLSDQSGTGTVGGADVGSVSVVCSLTSFSIAGSVKGLRGSGLVLDLNHQEQVAMAINGAFSFKSKLASGASYTVTVATQPTDPSQTCTIENGSGVSNGADVTSVAVSCTTNTYAIGGSVSGLLGSGAGLVLELNGGKTNGGETLDITAAGRFAFARKLENGTAYAVAVARQPTNPAQKCSVSGGNGTVAAADIDSIAVDCTGNPFAISFSVQGLTGSGLKLSLSGGIGGIEELDVPDNGTFTFKTRLAGAATYAITVTRNPTSPSQTCSVANGTGLGQGIDITNVTVVCSANAYTIGGTVSGLLEQNLELQLNGQSSISVSTNGTFSFPGKVASGAVYLVTVKTPPTNQTCLITKATATVGSTNVSDVTVNCSCSSGLQVCSGHCIDTSKDNANCGKCGHECGGAACVDGLCQPLVFRGSLTSTTGLAVTDDGVFFDSGGAVLKCPLTGCSSSPDQLALGFSEVRQLAVLGGSNARVAFIGRTSSLNGIHAREGLYSCPIAGCPIPNAAAYAYDVGYYVSINAILSSGSDFYYYWSHPGPNGSDTAYAISRCTDAPCSNPLEITTTAQAIYGNNTPTPCAADAANIYFISASGALSRCGNGAACATPSTMLGLSSAAKFVLWGGKIYWIYTGGPSGTIDRCSLENCQKETFFALPGAFTSDIAIDETGVYWLGGLSSTTRDLLRCPLTGCIGHPKTIATDISSSAKLLHLWRGFAYWLGADPVDSTKLAIWRVATAF